MRIILFLVGLIVFPWASNAVELSAKAQISLITGAAGKDAYAIFGHSAVRVYDAFSGIDIQYNYGTFDFDTPNFYMKFARGRLLYCLSVEDYPSFLRYYQREGRSVQEQVLDLSKADKQKLFDFLQNNARPQNRDYKYEFFYENCATRVRDVLNKVLGNKLVWKKDTDFKQQTFKQLLTPYLKEAWLNLGVYLILGLRADNNANQTQQMFLPDYLLKEVGKATIIENGASRPLAKPAQMALNMMVSTPPQSIFTPFLLTTLVATALAGLTFWEYKRGIRLRGIDFSLYLLTGLAGCFFVLMWTATDHLATHMNLNMLWAFPLHAVFAFWLLKREVGKHWRWYFQAFSIFQLLVLADWFGLPQQLHVAVIPLMLLLALRGFYLYQFQYKKTT